ncbi:hypothetical protein R4P47_15710 [Rhodococcus sp. IEGM 1370]|uniref:hypothetical protein n=1 Tax=Rhodococcus sp. IEGM 1370 TaxID=3082222 RepID=UPI0029543DC9|nr:hypothetical protein [Rhodococcus sp. IEGM 1370]MDV8078009.1 hypothetical protein [Rhodococcus sp. IEGM 1370]
MTHLDEFAAATGLLRSHDAIRATVSTENFQNRHGKPCESDRQQLCFAHRVRITSPPHSIRFYDVDVAQLSGISDECAASPRRIRTLVDGRRASCGLTENWLIAIGREDRPTSEPHDATNLEVGQISRVQEQTDAALVHLKQVGRFGL